MGEAKRRGAPGLKRAEPTKRQEEARLAMIEAVRPFATDMTPDEVLAVAAYLVGQLIAMQDAAKMTPGAAFEVVIKNIEAGNADAAKEAAIPGFWRSN